MADDAVKFAGISERQREVLQTNAFKPGQSGNPSGRPRKPLSERLIAELLKNDEAETAAIIKAWLEKAKAGDVPAIREALDRTEGKVADKQEHTGADGGPIEITVKFT